MSAPSRRTLALLAALTLAVAACGDDDAGTTTTTTTPPTTTEAVTTTTVAPTTTTTTTTIPPGAADSLIVFSRMLPGAGTQIFTIDADTGEETRLTDAFNAALMPVWSPDRQAIAFWTLGDEEYVWLMEDDGSDQVQITFFSSAVPDWGRGNRIGDGGPWLVFNSDGGGEAIDTPDVYAVLLASPMDRLQLVDSDPTLDFRPRVSPDGRFVLFGSDRDDPDLDLLVLDLETNQVTNLTAAQGGLEMNGDWSPDGTKIAYARGGDTDLDLWVMDADGSNPRPLVEGPGNQDSPSWSPDGTRLVFSTDDPTTDLWIVNADGTGARQLTFGEEPDLFPDWW